MPVALSGVLGEVGFYVPKKGQPVNVSDEVSPSTYGTLDADSICVDSDQAPGKFLTESKKPFPFRDLPLMGAGASLLDFLLHVSLLPGEAQS